MPIRDVNDFKITSFAPKLAAKHFRFDPRTYRLLEPGNVLLYGLAGGNDTRSNVIVNETEKERVADALLAAQKYSVTGVAWLMRPHRKGAKGLSKRQPMDSVLLFPAPLGADGALDVEQLAPSRSIKTPGARCFDFDEVTVERIAEIVRETTVEQAKASEILARGGGGGGTVSKLPTEELRVVWMRTRVAQEFKRVLLDAYSRRCAFCEFDHEAGLSAAHVLPWARASEEERTNIRNGILLCRNCHALFDAHLIRLSTTFTVRCHAAGAHERHGWRHEKRMRLPEPHSTPEPRFVARRYDLAGLLVR